VKEWSTALSFQDNAKDINALAWAASERGLLLAASADNAVAVYTAPE